MKMMKNIGKALVLTGALVFTGCNIVEEQVTEDATESASVESRAVSSDNLVIQTLQRGSKTHFRYVEIKNGAVDWSTAGKWGWFYTTGNANSYWWGDFPGSGTVEAFDETVIGNKMVVTIWISGTGYSCEAPIVNNIVKWDQKTNWQSAGTTGLPGSGSLTGYTNFTLNNTLYQAIWRSNGYGYTREVPIVNGQVQWQSASNWSSGISINNLPGSGTMRGCSNYIVNNTLFQTFWRGSNGYDRSVPVVNGQIQWQSASSWQSYSVNDLPGSGTLYGTSTCPVRIDATDMFSHGRNTDLIGNIAKINLWHPFNGKYTVLYRSVESGETLLNQKVTFSNGKGTVWLPDDPAGTHQRDLLIYVAGEWHKSNNFNHYHK